MKVRYFIYILILALYYLVSLIIVLDYRRDEISRIEFAKKEFYEEDLKAQILDISKDNCISAIDIKREETILNLKIINNKGLVKKGIIIHKKSFTNEVYIIENNYHKSISYEFCINVNTYINSYLPSWIFKNSGDKIKEHYIPAHAGPR